MTSPAGPSVSEIKAVLEFPEFSNCCLFGCKVEGSQALVLLVFMQQPAQHIPHQNWSPGVPVDLTNKIMDNICHKFCNNDSLSNPSSPCAPERLCLKRICLKSSWQPCSENKHLESCSQLSEWNSWYWLIVCSSYFAHLTPPEITLSSCPAIPGPTQRQH